MISVVVFIITILIYPFNMSRTCYNFRFRTLKHFIQNKVPFLKFLVPVVDGDLKSYDQFVTELSVEYYYDKISGYYSLVTFVLFLALFRYGLQSYQGDFYVIFDKVTGEFFVQLMYRFLYLLLFEAVTDALTRYFMLKVQKINVSNLGRNATIMNYRARFLFTVFMVYYLADIYYSLITTESFGK